MEDAGIIWMYLGYKYPKRLSSNLLEKVEQLGGFREIYEKNPELPERLKGMMKTVERFKEGRPLLNLIDVKKSY